MLHDVWCTFHLSCVATNSHRRSNDHMQRKPLRRVARCVAASHACRLTAAIPWQIALFKDHMELLQMVALKRGKLKKGGLPDLALASLSDDGAVLEEARSLARQLLDDDPELVRQPLLRAALEDQRQRQLDAAQLN